MGEIGQRLVDGLAGSADELGDFLLGQVVRHAQRPALLGAEPLSELQELFGDPAGHIGEDQVGEVVVGAAQTAGQHAQQLLGDLGPVGDPRAQRFAVHRHRSHLGDGGGARGARARVEDGQLAEHVGRSHDRQQILPAVRRAATDLHLAGDDDVQPVPRLPFGEHGVSAREVHGLQLFGQRGYGAGFHPLEDSGPGQDLVHVAPLKLFGVQTCVSNLEITQSRGKPCRRCRR